ncbi:MAG: DinB family protein [Chloroflexota bacterium]|nr:DinB family protein [Chloroflexota bacterium]
MEAVVGTVRELFRAVHADLRSEVRGLDAAALNWTPGEGTNSIAALVVHTLGSEAEVLRTVRDVAGERDRDAEFRVSAETANDLVQALDDGDALLDEMTAGMTTADLAAVRLRGDREPQPGLYWLLSNYGHAREHLAHVQLTKQLYGMRQGT